MINEENMTIDTEAIEEVAEEVAEEVVEEVTEDATKEVAEEVTEEVAEIDETLIDSFVQEEEIDPNEEKLKEMNKKLPKWSLEPPKGFLK